MAKFFFKQQHRVFIIKPARVQVIDGTVVNLPEEKIEVKTGFLETTDQKVIDRLRRDGQYGTGEITERTEEDDEAIEIHQKKQKEAEEEIKARKKLKKEKKETKET